MLAEVALAALISACAPHVHPTTMLALIARESNGHQYAIDDDTDRRSYLDDNERDAVVRTKSLLARGHDLDVGYAQINVRNLVRFHIDPARAFDACLNVATGARILRDDYTRARRRYTDDAAALDAALAAYHGGRFARHTAYASAVARIGLGVEGARGRRAP